MLNHSIKCVSFFLLDLVCQTEFIDFCSIAAIAILLLFKGVNFQFIDVITWFIFILCADWIEDLFQCLFGSAYFSFSRRFKLKKSISEFLFIFNWVVEFKEEKKRKRKIDSNRFICAFEMEIHSRLTGAAVSRSFCHCATTIFRVSNPNYEH